MLLDTCALLWLSQGGGRLTRRAIEVIEFSPELYISAISGFEIGIKHQKGKLMLPLSVNEWFEIIVEHHDLSILTLDLNICTAATELPPIHKDPCDRFIIASAKLYDMPFVDILYFCFLLLGLAGSVNASKFKTRRRIIAFLKFPTIDL